MYLFAVDYYYYFTPHELFTTALAGNILLESEWQQVSSGLLDSSEYFGWSLQCYSLDYLNLSSDFLLFPVLFSNLWGPFQVCQSQLVPSSSSSSTAFSVLWQGLRTCVFFCFLWFSQGGLLEWQNPLYSKLSLFFFFSISLCLVSWPRLVDPFVSQIPREF